MTDFTLTQVETNLWRLLQKGQAEARHPCHTPTLGTTRAGQARLRTVILRAVEAERGELACHTDYRSDKISEIQANAQVQWHFYAAEEKVQIRLEAQATIHYQDDWARERWQTTPLSSRRIYLLKDVPGTPISDTADVLPAQVRHRAPTLEESEKGWIHFAVVQTVITRIDWLYLAAEGHRRAQFGREAQGPFLGQWVAP